MEGEHDIYDAAHTTENVLHNVFNSLYDEDVDLEHMILKPNMVLHGYSSNQQNDPIETANITLKSFRKTVPAAVGAIAFLSGGQDDGAALNNLASLNKEFYLPWIMSFSFGRTMQNGALKYWSKSDIPAAQAWTYHRAESCSNAIEFGTDYNYKALSLYL